MPADAVCATELWVPARSNSNFSSRRRCWTAGNATRSATAAARSRRSRSLRCWRATALDGVRLMPHSRKYPQESDWTERPTRPTGSSQGSRHRRLGEVTAVAAFPADAPCGPIPSVFLRDGSSVWPRRSLLVGEQLTRTLFHHWDSWRHEVRGSCASKHQQSSAPGARCALKCPLGHGASQAAV